MKQKIINALIFIGGMAVAIGVLVWGFHLYGNNCCICPDGDACCPCPNYEVMPEVSNWSGKDACCASTWAKMCHDYKEAHNVSFQCFQ